LPQPRYRLPAAVQYEQAKNRISAGRLYELSKVLGVPVTFFFEGIAADRSRAVIILPA
jgi:transcriptional regulator with XRE-family HTH domain